MTRGGSHSTGLVYLRSANRMGTLREDKSWMIGFRVVIGELPDSKPVDRRERGRWARDVREQPHDWSDGPDPDKPYFEGPRRYVNIPEDAKGPLFGHNHCPAIVGCPNGDLLAIWYSCIREPGRELGILGSRLRRGADQWEPASVFWNAPDRNDHASALWFDGDRTIYHFNGLSTDATWGKLALVMRRSTDNGRTWERARLIDPEHGWRNMPVESVIRTREGAILLPCDAVPNAQGGTAIHVSWDEGETWTDPGAGRPRPGFEDGGTGAWIAGIHAGIAQLRDGRLLAFGRHNNINGKMPKSISDDLGEHWTYSASEFPPIGGGQRLVLMRLREGPLFFASFADRIAVRDATGEERNVRGLFGAVSYDDGVTWPVRRLITDDRPKHLVETTDGRTFAMSRRQGEPGGYLSVCQTPEGVIHLISSRQHYAFNLKWLTTAPPAIPPPPEAQELPEKGAPAYRFDAKGLPTEAEGHWRFTGSGGPEASAVSFPEGGVMQIDTGQGQRTRWADDSAEGFGRVDADRGFTVQVRLQIVKSGAGRGIDIEACIGDGATPGRRYFITVTETAVLWHDAGFQAVAEELDNCSAMHDYRLAVRDDGNVQIYRDDDLLAVREFSYGLDGMLDARGPYFQWGEGAGAVEIDALIEHAAYDLGGAYAPQR